MDKQRFWFRLMSISSTIYILWRLFFTIPTDSSIISLIFGILLFVAELISMTEVVIYYTCIGSEKEEPPMPKINAEDYPFVDVLIATHSESEDVLYKTVNGCKHLEYPDASKVKIFLCDDGNREEIARLAEDMGVGYLPLANNTKAKAGNLNNAISKTSAPLILTLDADMIPRKRFLLETVPYFFLPKMIEENGNWRKRTEEELDPNFKVGFVQTPQSFYNPDLFQFNFFAENNIPNEQDYFFRIVNVGRNRSNSAIYAGSNTVISREALESVGGIKEGTITEDFATGIEIEAKGYTCYGVKKVLASGLAPTDFPNLIKQRKRWGRGCVQVLRGGGFLKKSKLTKRAKMSYLACLLYWWTFTSQMIFILSPILFSVFGLRIVDTGIKELLLIWLPAYLIYNYALHIISSEVRDQKWSGIINTIFAPYLIFPIIFESLGIKLKKFSVTNKETISSKSSRLYYATIHMVLLALSGVGIYNLLREMIIYKTIGPAVVLFWLIYNSYLLFMSIIFMVGRVNYRSCERYNAKIPVSLSPNGEKIYGETADISENGFSLVLDFPEFISGTTEFCFDDGEHRAKVNGSIVHVNMQGDGKWKYSIKLQDDLDREQKAEYFELVYDREPSLATTINTSAKEDLANYFKRKRSKYIHLSRKLPRISLSAKCMSSLGREIAICEYNYNYVKLEKSQEEREFSIYFGEVELKLERADELDQEKRLYLVTNWREISSEKDIKLFLSYSLGTISEEELILS